MCGTHTSFILVFLKLPISYKQVLGFIRDNAADSEGKHRVGQQGNAYYKWTLADQGSSAHRATQVCELIPKHFNYK